MALQYSMNMVKWHQANKANRVHVVVDVEKSAQMVVFLRRVEIERTATNSVPAVPH